MFAIADVVILARDTGENEPTNAPCGIHRRPVGGSPEPWPSVKTVTKQEQALLRTRVRELVP